MARLRRTIWMTMTFTTGLLLGQSPGLAAEKEPKASWRLRDKRDQLIQVRRELDRQRQQATQVARKEQSLFEELDRIDQQLQQKGRELKGLHAKLRSSTERLRSLQKETGLTQKQLDRMRELFRRRVRAIYKHGRLGYVRALFSSDDLTAAGRRVKYLAVIANQDQRMVATYTAALETLQMQQVELERWKAELVNNQKAVTAKREEILGEQRARRVVLAKVQEQKKAHLAAIRQLESAARELQTLIGRLQSGERLRLSRRPARGPEPAPAPSEGTGAFAALKGRLPWPTPGTLGSSFGRQEHPRHRTVTFNRGIEINAPLGQKIVAVSGGTVLYADWFKGYGQLIVLDHGEGYYTVYAHAAEILVKLGDRVVKGQSIGLVGDTGSVTGSQLYFEVRHRGRPQDPLTWLAPS
ncbi:MAG: peptidoglycan DD-metalloendopeptidase family protein [Candidatus Methylomirabilis oxyfera]|nr:peptidoglycan DD-metalloendopeptidase family protein [Candidatus Methylomirabilis oxyfera]